MAARFGIIAVILFVVHCSYGVTNHQMNHGFHPNTYYRFNDQMAEASGRVETTLEKLDTSPENGNSIGSNPEQRTQRFGITAYGGSGAYPSAGGPPSVYSPVKIDLGGVLVGSLIGLGAILFLPKLVQAFSYSYGGGGYGRSVEADVSTFTNILTKIDEILERNNIDSSSCAQRITCTYVQSSLDNMAVGNGTDVDQFISTLSENNLISYMLDGTAIKQAIEAGRDVNSDCESMYSRCKIDKQSLMKIISGII